MRETKDSGIEWIGEIPYNWKTLPLKSIVNFGKGLPITKENLKEQGIPVISYGQIHSKQNNGVHVTDNLIRYVDKKYLELNASSLGFAGDIFVADTSEDLEGIGNAILIDTNESIFAGYHTILLKAKLPYYSRYLAYLFLTDSWRNQLRSRASGIKVFSVTKKMLMATSIILPPATIASNITAFLDQKCSEVDAITKDIQAQIDTLEQYKRSVITEAVTKGLDPDVEMKDSGIHWLGQIPIRWTTERIGGLYTDSNETGNDELPILTVSIHSGISDRELSDDETAKTINRSSDRSMYKRVRPGDIAYNMMRAWQGSIGCARVDGMVSPAYVVARPTTDYIDSRYMEYLLRTPAAIEEMHRYSYGIADFRLRLYWPNFKTIKVCVPPHDEQIQIADYLDKKTQEIECLIKIKKEQLETLSDYKKSLIYEYVTGKKEVPAE